jgi:hypothetical protein
MSGGRSSEAMEYQGTGREGKRRTQRFLFFDFFADL